MQKFSVQKRLGPYVIDKALFQHIEAYINRNVPRILLLNLEKGNENPLSDYITIAVQQEHHKQNFRGIDTYGYEQFERNVEEVSIELVHNNKFNFWGQKVIVLIMTFNLKSGYCDLSLALNDEASKEKVYTIEKGLRAIMNKNRKATPLLKFFR